MRKKIRSIERDFKKRKYFLKNEIKRIIYRSIIQNLHVKPKIRANVFKKIVKIQTNYFISRQNNNLCLNSGRFKGVLKLTNLCRHETKKFGLVGSLQNIKIKSW